MIPVPGPMDRERWSTTPCFEPVDKEAPFTTPNLGPVDMKTLSTIPGPALVDRLYFLSSRSRACCASRSRIWRASRPRSGWFSSSERLGGSCRV